MQRKRVKDRDMQTNRHRERQRNTMTKMESKQFFATNHLDPTPATPTHTHKFHTKYTIKLVNEYQRQANIYILIAFI